MTPEGPGVVENVDLLKEEVNVRLDHETDSLIVTYPADELDAIRPEGSETHRRK
ncbi:MAG: hypothetical protein GX991_04765 [Clostridiaceae bacterium]|nr:hypothetical protein [Clostridiaceae bacterium]